VFCKSRISLVKYEVTDDKECALRIIRNDLLGSFIFTDKEKFLLK
jgi:hypothetical protein